MLKMDREEKNIQQSIKARTTTRIIITRTTTTTTLATTITI